MAGYSVSVSAALLAMTLALAPQRAACQPLTFEAIKALTLTPAPGAEREARELSKLLRDSTRPVLIDSSTLVTADLAGVARCTVRTDLPKPRRLGLECYTHDGTYIGMLRAKEPRLLVDRLLNRDRRRDPWARPLTAYRYIYVEPLADDAGGYREYLVGLFRADHVYMVIDSPDWLPREESDYLLRCRVSIHSGEGGPTWMPTIASGFTLTDAHEGGFGFHAGGTTFLGIAYRDAMRRGLRGAFKEMVRTRDENRETYSAPPPPKGGA
jgi:hypothetical protein